MPTGLTRGTDRIDLDMLLRTLLAWLRGEPRVCSMVRIPSETEEDMRQRERERLIMVVALARKLLVALWRYVETGEVPAGARLAAA